MVFSDIRHHKYERAVPREEHPVRAAKFDRRALVDKVECNALRQEEGTSALHVLLDKGRMDWAAGGG